jgi:hypothetical protein
VFWVDSETRLLSAASESFCTSYAESLFRLFRTQAALCLRQFQLSAGGKPMFYLSLLFTSITQILSNPSPVNHVEEPAVFCIPDSVNSASNCTWDATEDYLLPSGIVSLEHWIDLNA